MELSSILIALIFMLGATALCVVLFQRLGFGSVLGFIAAGATAGPKTGAQAKTEYHNGMATFVHSKGGLMAEMAVGGQKFSFQPAP